MLMLKLFKNIIAYEYYPSDTDFSQIQTLIRNYIFTPLDKYSMYTAGVAPFDDDDYIIEFDNRILLKIIFSSKNVSEKMVSNLTDERIENAKKEKGVNKVSDEIRNIYENQVRSEFLKYTTPTNKTVLLLIDKKTHYIYANTSNTSLAEETIHFVRKVIGKLACRNLYLLPSFYELPIELMELKLSKPNNSPCCLRIHPYPSVITHNSEDVKIVVTGIDKNSGSFIDMLGGRRLKSLELELVSEKEERLLVVAEFILSFSERGIPIIKNLKSCHAQPNVQYISIKDECISIMDLVGQYMKLIIDSLHGNFKPNKLW